MVRVLIADDHQLVRKSLRRLLEKQKRLKVVGEARDGEHTLTLTGALKPDVLILDMAMPRMDGMQVLRALQKLVHRPAVVVLSMSNSSDLKQEAVWAGADVFLTKGGAVETLLGAIEEVAGKQSTLAQRRDG